MSGCEDIESDLLAGAQAAAVAGPDMSASFPSRGNAGQAPHVHAPQALVAQDALPIIRERLATRHEPLARVLLDDIARGRGGGTYYMDGRPIDPNAGDFYAVGGASSNGRLMLTADELADERYAHAAVRLMRQEIMKLHDDSDEPVGIGFWINNGFCHLDLSNIVLGREHAEALARQRGEIAMYSFAAGREIRFDSAE